MKIEGLKIGQTVFVKGIITDIEKDEILDLEIHTSENNFYVNSSDVYASPIQQKIEVPQCVIDWVDDSRERDYEFDEWFDPDNHPLEVYKWLNCKNKRQADINALALVTLIVNGPDAVTVQKEKLYTVEIPNPNRNSKGCAKFRLEKLGDKVYLVKRKSKDVYQNKDSQKLTEQEIRKDFDWAWQQGFAEEVTE
ncbi:phage protein [Streptococcus pseudoporcinus]|uniref:Phage protein n=1 Tax=Streptococcus pseudoporcinus TaxID=361101 RepID=A0A4U9XL09_9STRE|nr:DUF1642 domain-containing protein [Streptococcus pseudoporcinus]QBX18708.1 hypothetical protein Javan443_0034 [Streptococcus phage Javan443]QBX18773.1 hypothetical protein Javan445_0033 [Streptococcus phage Javan445]VTS13465.1 phage protein [Streptococcus pseudoporcinus]VTS19770.1 phage protein [Streptococcus pseudoporcinus]VUC69674.1 phage protein [Streptococcus pseudoporcinus]